jgi:Fic family protein
MLMGEILVNAGNFRNKDVGVGNSNEVSHIAPPFIQVPNLMQDLFDYLKNDDEHPLIKSSVFHYEFEFIHPFIDGNGRIGRYWQTLILYNWKKIFRYIPIESVIRDSHQGYYKAIEDSSSLGKSTPFIEFILEIILKTCKKSLKDFQNDPLNDPLNDPKKRLENILSFIKQDNYITTQKLAQKLDVSQKTVKRDIVKLKEQNKLKRVGKKGGFWEIL